MPDDKPKVVKVLASSSLVVGTPVGTTVGSVGGTPVAEKAAATPVSTSAGTPGVIPSAPAGEPVPVAAKDTDVLPPATTAEQDRKTIGQRRINLIWEITQAIIAIVVAIGTMAVSAMLVLKGDGASATAFLLLSNAFFMIVTAYFQRTNHTRTGGVGTHDDSPR